ncbi:hypothetical protein PG995_016318 [Apiospora arundinis]
MAPRTTGFCFPGPVVRDVYLIQLLASWAIRSSEFSLVLFLAGTFPGTLLYVSIHGIGRSLAAVLLGPWVGAFVDRQDRLRAMHRAVFCQRASVVLSCALMLMVRRMQHSLTEAHGLTLHVCLCLFFALACVEKVAAMANFVAWERDWVVVVAEAHGLRRQNFNASLRRVDLACKLFAPSLVGFLDTYWSQLAMCVVLVWNVCSIAVEFWATRRVYNRTPQLAQRLSPSSSTSSASSTTEKLEDEKELLAFSQSLLAEPNLTTPTPTTAPVLFSLAPWREYVRSPVFLASFSGCILYFTVLYFGGQIISYLFSLGFTSMEVTMLRMASVFAELGGTWMAPIMMDKVGPARAGLFFLFWQVVCLAIFAGPVITHGITTKFVGLALALGITFKRLGLWGTDLSIQYMVQATTPPQSRAVLSTTEVACQQLFELFACITTTIFSRPDQFLYPVLISYSMILVATATYSLFVWKMKYNRHHAMIPNDNS